MEKPLSKQSGQNKKVKHKLHQFLRIEFVIICGICGKKIKLFKHIET